jgi:hypothetical protein
VHIKYRKPLPKSSPVKQSLLTLGNTRTYMKGTSWIEAQIWKLGWHLGKAEGRKPGKWRRRQGGQSSRSSFQKPAFYAEWVFQS